MSLADQAIDPAKPTKTNRTAYPVDRGVLMPGKTAADLKAQFNGKGRPPVYPWHLMDIGDSFLVPDTTIKSMSAKASQTGARMSRRYECRTVKGGIRVWRTG